MRHRTTLQVFGVPILLGIATLLGLGAGLIGDGVWDVGAGLLLALPLIVTGRYWVRPPEPVLRRQQLRTAPIRQ